MGDVDIKFDEAKLRSIQKMLAGIPKAMPKAMSRAINKTATSSKAEIARRIAAEIKLTQTAVKKGIGLQKATYARWQARLGIGDTGGDVVAGKQLGRKSGRIPLIYFGARKTKHALTYQISRIGGRKKITDKPVPFVQTMNTFKGVFRRLTKKRFPVTHLYGPSLAGVFEGAAGIAADVQKSAYVKLEKNIDSQIRYLLSKRKTA